MFACACLLFFRAAEPKYLIRQNLIDMRWSEFAAKISAGEQDVVVPLNPGWRTVINQTR